MLTIEVLVGPVASGKSTYARKRAAEGALVVCHDDLCRQVHAGNPVGPNACGYEPALRDCYRGIEEALAWRILNAGRDCIVDRTHLTRESRKRWLDWVRGYISLSTYEGRGPEVRVVAVTFPIERAEVHAHRRFESDPRGRSLSEWIGVAVHHAGQAEAEPLAAAEGFAEIRAGSFEPEDPT